MQLGDCTARGRRRQGAAAGGEDLEDWLRQGNILVLYNREGFKTALKLSAFVRFGEEVLMFETTAPIA